MNRLGEVGQKGKIEFNVTFHSQKITHILFNRNESAKLMITQLFLIRWKVLKHKYTERPQNTEHFWCLLLGYCIIFNKPSFLMPPTNLQFLFPNAKCLPMVLDFCPLTKTNAIPFFFIFYDGIWWHAFISRAGSNTFIQG